MAYVQYHPLGLHQLLQCARWEECYLPTTCIAVVIGHTVMLVKYMKAELKPFPNLIKHTVKPMATTSAEVTVSVVSTSQDIHNV